MTPEKDELMHPSLNEHMAMLKERNNKLQHITNQEGRAEREFNEALKTWTRGLTDIFSEYNSKRLG